MVAHAGHECCLGGFAQGWNIDELNTWETCFIDDCVVWLLVGCGGVGMVVAVLVVLFSTQVCGAFGSAGLLEGDMIGGVMVVMFGALLGFEATSLLTGS